jgi:hypothetical protein
MLYLPFDVYLNYVNSSFAYKIKKIYNASYTAKAQFQLIAGFLSGCLI